VILQTLKKLSLVSLGMVLGAALYSCAEGLGVKVYKIDPAQGLVRKQAGEVIPFAKASGYFCMSPSDTEAVVAELNACRQAKP
jgi:hypothetical protein